MTSADGVKLTKLLSPALLTPHTSVSTMLPRSSSLSVICTNSVPKAFSTNIRAMAMSRSGLKAWITSSPFTALPTGPKHTPEQYVHNHKKWRYPWLKIVRNLKFQFGFTVEQFTNKFFPASNQVTWSIIVPCGKSIEWLDNYTACESQNGYL